MTSVKGQPPSASKTAEAEGDANFSRSDSMRDPHITDGFLVPDLDPPQDAPPSYGEHHDQMQFSQPGFEAGAAITDAGRVSININTKNRRLADLLTPAINSQVSPESQAPLPPAYIPPSLGGQPGQDPPPRLNVVIQIVGSRGDVQPFVALGKVLRDTYGHRVRVATHPTFQSFVEENGLEFFSIGGDPAELMAFMVKHPGLAPGFDAIKSGEVTKRRKGISDMLLGCWRSCIETGNGLGPPPRPQKDESLDLSTVSLSLLDNDGREPFVADAIIANPPSFAHIHLAEKLGIPLHMMFTMPWTPTRAFPHPLADINSSNADDLITKYLSYTLVEMMTWQGLGDIINQFRGKALNLAPLSLLWAPGLLNRLKVPYTYCWSPALIPKPNDWGRHIDISGFFFLDLATSYTPEPDLAAFLDAGPPPVYIGFGSIVVDDPNALTEMIFEAVRRTGVRALVSKGWGGLGANEVGIPDNVFMLGNVPHDWLFQRVACVVHHGGAGTTAAGIKAGKPTLIVPFFGDQPFWGAMVARAKAGPEPIAYKKLTADNLAQAIQFCLESETIEQAREYGEKIREEKGTDVGGQSFHSNLDIDSLRCSLAPSRTAVWRLRRSQVRLSPLAAATLVEEGILQYADLKLYRPREYNTDAQPPDPISAAASSLVMDATGIGMAIADMPREMFKSRNRSRSNNQAEDISRSSSPPAVPEEGSSRAGDNLAEPRDTKDVGMEPGTTPGRSSPTTPLVVVESEAANQAAVTDTSSTITSSAATTGSGSSSHQNRRKSPSFSRRDSSPVGVGIDAAVGAGKSVGKIVTTGVKSPMNFCLGLAKGFRNVPTLYNDDTVRPVEKVTGIGSGLKIASKEFGYGLFDGISGLVTQPLRGAEKEGAGGLVKGFGKGIGGLITKPAAGFWGIPAYTMQGVHAEVTKLFTRSSQNYVITSRVIQGKRDLRSASPEERQDIIDRWHRTDLDIKAFQVMKRKEKASQKAPASPYENQHPDATSGASLSQGSWQSLLSSNEGLARLASRKDGWLRGIGGNPSASSTGLSARPNTTEDAEFEQAIQSSVRETSRGNPEEDAAVEAAIRQSVMAVRRQGALPEPVSTTKTSDADKKDPAIFDDADYQITDEEYQTLIEQAIQESLAGQSHSNPLPHDTRLAELDGSESRYQTSNQAKAQSTTYGAHDHLHDDDDDDVDLRRAIEESRSFSAGPSVLTAEEEDYKRAIAASQEDTDREKVERTKEDIVMEYVKQQSLAEAEYKRQQWQAKQEEGSVGDGDKTDKADEDEDEDLKRALEESLKMSRGDESGPSQARSS